MSEHDISKHTKKIYKIWKAPNDNWKHKLGEIITEILIIVFAITLSLFVERWREHTHDNEIEKQFLLGLKQDLRNDIAQQQSDSTSYALLLNGWRYLRFTGMENQNVNEDSLKKYSSTLISTTDFIPNDSRFEGLKSSGNLGVLENDSLQNLILDLYQNKIKMLQSSTNYFTHFKQEQLTPFLNQNLQIHKDGSTNIGELIHKTQMQNYLLLGDISVEILERYHAVMQESRKIIQLINEQYELHE
jgi:type II secretory pathway pseudopilin PulG